MKMFKFNKGKKLNIKVIITIVIVILVVSSIIAACILYNRDNNFRQFMDKYVFRKNTYENNLPYIEIESNKLAGAYAYNKYVVLLQNNKLEIYSKSGRNESEIDVDIATPIFESNQNYLAIAEKNGGKIYFINGKNTVWQKDIEGKITSICINKNGYVALTLSGTSYKTAIKTYDSNGNELFTSYLANTNVVATDISNDNKYLAIAEANFSGIVVQSSVKIISIEDAKNNTGNSIYYTHIASSGDLITNIKYQKNNLVCMYDSHIDVLSDNQNSELINFKDEDVLFADISLNNKVVKIVKKSSGLLNSETEMQIIDSGNRSVTTYQIENVPKSILIKENIIAVNLGTKALFIKDNGWLEKTYESSHEIQNIILCGEIGGIISKNKIEIISL